MRKVEVGIQNIEKLTGGKEEDVYIVNPIRSNCSVPPTLSSVHWTSRTVVDRLPEQVILVCVVQGPGSLAGARTVAGEGRG